MATRNQHSMDAALGAVMRSMQGSPSGCDAELAVAYAEGRLDRKERERVEAHLSGCSACRALTSTVLEESAPQAVSPAPVRRWLAWRWAVPAMAGIAIVGSVVYYQRDRIQPAPAAKQVSQATGARSERDAAPVPATPARVLEEQPQNKPIVSLRGDEQKAIRQPPVPKPEPAAPAPPPQREAAPAENRQAQDKLETAAAATAKEKSAEQKIEPLRLMDQESGKPEARRRGYAAPVSAGLVAQRAPEFTPLPDAAPLRHFARRGDRVWAVSDGGRIFRSTDAGRTWEKLESPTTADLIRATWESDTSLLVEDKEGNQYRLQP